MDIGRFVLVNPEKLDRAINGSVSSEGQAKGGVGVDADEKDILAEYDRLGGLIKMDGKYKVKTGCFYDVKAKAAVAKPKPMLLFVINGETIEVDGTKPLPLEVQASEIAKKRKAKKAAKKGKKGEETDEEESEDADEEESKDDEEAELA